jgi:iron complex outermembrane receptor protein
VVQDPAESLVADVQVALDNAHTHLTATTDSTGAYRFLSVPAGTYQITARRNGFDPIIIPSITVSAGQSVTQNLSFLHLNAAVSVSVTVYGNTSGTTETGYYADQVQQGVFGNVPIVNQPYTITVHPRPPGQHCSELSDGRHGDGYYRRRCHGAV